MTANGDALPVVWAGLVIGTLGLATICAVFILTGDPCGDASRSEWIIVAALLFGATALFAAVRLVPHWWQAVVAGLAVTGVSGMVLVVVLLAQGAETCPAA